MNTPGSIKAPPDAVAIHAAIEDVWGARKFNTKSFGAWAKNFANAYVEGFRLTVRPDPHTKTNTFIISGDSA